MELPLQQLTAMRDPRIHLCALVPVLLSACADVHDIVADDDPDPSELTSETSEPVSCNPKLVYYPVRGRHNNGYDPTAGDSSQWTCNADHSNSDYSVALNHLGNDIWASKGTPVVATVSGKLTLVGFTAYSGNKVTIIDSCGWYHFSTHLDSIAPGIVSNKQIAAGTVIGYVGSTGTAANHTVHLHYSIYPDGNYNAGIDPWPYLKAVESNVCDTGAPPPNPTPTDRYWVDTFGNANGYAVPGVDPLSGWLFPGTNYVFCKVAGPMVTSGSSFNHWWLKTDLDASSNGRPTRGQYISAFQLSRWGNDEAKDNNGAVIPDCTPPTPPPTTKFFVDTFASATGYSAPGGTATGTLNAGTNYVYCKRVGPNVAVGAAHNHYWMLTDLDSGSPSKNQWVSAYYLSRWGNDEAKDNNGNVLPDCP
jgi:peptidase M23-like protein